MRLRCNLLIAEAQLKQLYGAWFHLEYIPQRQITKYRHIHSCQESWVGYWPARSSRGEQRKPWMSDVLSHCVLLTWPWPWQRCEKLRPMKEFLSLIPGGKSEKEKVKPSLLAHVMILTVCAENAQCSFLLRCLEHEDCFPYRDCLSKLAKPGCPLDCSVSHKSHFLVYLYIITPPMCPTMYNNLPLCSALYSSLTELPECWGFCQRA